MPDRLAFFIVMHIVPWLMVTDKEAFKEADLPSGEAKRKAIWTR